MLFRSVLTRFVCRNTGGTPARYHIDSLPVSGGNAHGLDIAPDGSLLIASSYTGHALRVSPGGAVTDLGFVLSFPVGIAGDVAGNVYVTNRCSQTVVKIAPNLAQSTLAGTGVVGHSGDGGPATRTSVPFDSRRTTRCPPTSPTRRRPSRPTRSP